MAATRRSARLHRGSDSGHVPPGASSNVAQAPAGSLPKERKRKAAVEDSGAETSPAEPSSVPPVTPIKRQRRDGPSLPPPPATPTPSAIGLIAEGVPATAKKPRTAAVARLADPNATNAPLLSPETSRIIAPRKSPASTTASPSKPPRIAPTSSLLSEHNAAPKKTTTENILQIACDHLISVDPRMKPLVDKHHCRVFSPEGLAEKIDPFESLCSGIISQQVSGAAAKSIKAKFVALFDGVDLAAGRFPHPSHVAPMSIEKLRTAGLSQRKAEYIKGLAEKFAAGDLSAQMLADAPYEEVLSKLIAVRGLGQWSVEMFACFALKRMDVFSLGDLGVQRGMAAFVGRDVAKLKAKGGGKWKYMSEKEMVEISEKFAPYRSVYMWYMWRVEETDISTLE